MTALGSTGGGHAPVRQFPTLTPFRAPRHARDPRGVLRLASSESPYGPSEAARRAAAAELSRLNLYPHSDAEPLRSEIARHHGVATDQILVGNGIDELILQVAQATASFAGLGITTTNTFAGYAASMEIAGHPLKLVPLGAHGIDNEQLIAGMDGPGCVMVANPHSPTGTSLGRRHVTALVEAARRVGTVLVLDEAYAEYADGDPDLFASGLDHVAGGSVVVLRTFSKAYGLAGLRVGYAIGDESVIAAMLAQRNALPYNTNRIALVAAQAALADQPHLRHVVSANRLLRTTLAEELEQRRIPVLPSQANFVLANFRRFSHAVVALMAGIFGVHVLDASDLGFPGWVRITVPTEADLPHLLGAIDACSWLRGASSTAWSTASVRSSWRG